MSPPPDEGGSGVYAELAVRPDCPVATVARELPLREFVPATGSGPPRFIVERSTDTPTDREALRSVAWTDETVVCRVTDGAGCGHEHCPICNPGGLPLDPLSVRWQEGELHLHVAARERAGVQRCIDAVSDVSEVRPVRLSPAGATSDAHRRAVLHLDELTDRQWELARAAADRGYFDPDGPSAETVAEEFGITKSTLSEHLRAVQRKLFDQLF
jgi:hypothetical protein